MALLKDQKTGSGELHLNRNPVRMKRQECDGIFCRLSVPADINQRILEQFSSLFGFYIWVISLKVKRIITGKHRFLVKMSKVKPNGGDSTSEITEPVHRY